MNARPPAVWLERARSGLCHRCCRERRCSFSSCCDNGRCLPNTHCVVPSCRWPAVRHVSIVRAACFRFAHVWERSPAVEGGRVLQLDWQGHKEIIKSCLRLASFETHLWSTLSGFDIVPRPAHCCSLNSKHTCCQPALFGGKWFFTFHQAATCSFTVSTLRYFEKMPWH